MQKNFSCQWLQLPYWVQKNQLLVAATTILVQKIQSLVAATTLVTVLVGTILDASSCCKNSSKKRGNKRGYFDQIEQGGRRCVTQDK